MDEQEKFIMASLFYGQYMDIDHKINTRKSIFK